MSKWNKKKLMGLRDRDSTALFHGHELIECELEDCAAIYTSPKSRGTFKDITLKGCRTAACVAYGAVFDTVVVDTLNTKGQLLQLWGSAFKNVTLRGRIDRLMISPIIFPTRFSSEQQAAFDTANAKFYRNVKWSLDIREALFSELDISGIPARLVKRDPVSQIVVRADKYLDSHFGRVPLNSPRWQLQLQRMVQRGEVDNILVAPKLNSEYELLVDDLRRLQSEGIAEAE